MAIHVTPDQQKAIFAALSGERSRDYAFLWGYLNSIKDKHDVDFLIAGNQIITLPYEEAWNLIFLWGQGDRGQLPVGDREGIATVGAAKLLGYLETNIIGKDSLVGAARYQIIENAKTDRFPSAPAALVKEKSAISQYNELLVQISNDHAIGLLQNEYEKSRFLSGFDGDTRRFVAYILATNAGALGQFDPNNLHDRTPDRIQALLRPYSGKYQVNNVIHAAYSVAATEDNVDPHHPKPAELSEIASISQDYLQQHPDYSDTAQSLRTISALAPTLVDIPLLLSLAIPNAPQAERDRLASSLTSTILASARGQHVDGKTMIANALSRAGYAREVITPLSDALTPYIETIEANSRQQLLTGDFRYHDARTSATMSLAEEIGVNPDIPWLTSQDLYSLADRLAPNSQGTVDGIRAAYYQAIDSNNLPLASELKLLLSNATQFENYHNRLNHSSFLSLREALAKTQGNIQAANQPIAAFTSKVMGGFANIENVVNWPSNKLFELWDRAGKKLTFTRKLKNGKILAIPFLDLPGFAYNQWINFQKGISLRVYTWSIKVAKNGDFFGFFRHVADYSRAFYKADASWGLANTAFFEKKWGDLLNWTARKVGQGSWEALKKSLTTYIESAGNKLASGLGSKIVEAIGFGTSELGVGLLLLGAQALWEIGKSFFSKITKFLGSVFQGKGDNVGGIFAMLGGSAFLALNAMLAGIPVIALAAFEVLRAAGKLIWDGLVTIVILAAAVSLILVTIAFLLFQVFKTTINLDSGTAQITANIVCTLTGSGTPSSSSNPRLAAGKCIYQLLNQFHINPLNKGNAGGANFSAFATELGNGAAADVAQASAQQFGAFQCVGLDTVVSMMTGGSSAFYANAKDMLSNPPPGYHPVYGVGSCSPGDFFVDTGGTWGHTGLFVKPAGAVIICIDANSDGYGTVRDETTCQWPSSRIAGCLKKN
jgi:hypothetical protein